MATPNEPANEPPEGNVPPAAATVVVTPAPATPPPEINHEAEAILEEIGERIEAVEQRITEGLEGERQWTTTSLTSLRQELADLKATLQQVTANLPQRLTELREELIQKLRELVQASPGPSNPPEGTITRATVTQVTPPAEPPISEGESPADTPEIVTANDASRAAMLPTAEKPKTPRRRVV